MFTIRREPENPILIPRHTHPWESVATFNPSVSQTENGVYLFYRALGNSSTIKTPTDTISTIGMALSEDGIHFHSRKQIITPKESWEKFGCEDPHVSFFEGKWYCFYTALGGYPFGPDTIKVALAIGDAPDNFTERHIITPFNAKDATLFPERVDGDIVMLLTVHTDWTEEYPYPTIALARAKRIEDFFNSEYWQQWHAHLAEQAIPEMRRSENDYVEVGAAPLLTEQGWLLIYSYTIDFYNKEKSISTVESALLDKNNPQKLISRTESIIVPQESYEEYGLVPNAVFPTGATRDNTGMLNIWYGAAATVCAKASVRFSDIIRALNPEDEVRTFRRASRNPILIPRGNGFEERDVFNAASIEINGTIYILYRAMNIENTSTIGLAISRDGVVIDERLSEPIYVPRAEFEMKRGNPNGNSGCEDPRIVRIGDTLYMTYTAYDGVHNPAGAVSSISVDDFLSRRFTQWGKPIILTPNDINDKDTALLPEKIDENFLLYHRINNQICADLLSDISSGKKVNRCIEIIGPRHGMWDGARVGVAAPPIKVGDRWLMLYHGVSRHNTYRLGAILLDAKGTSVLARTADPVFEPTESYEKDGEIHNVVFSCGTVVRGDTVFLYYGAADKVLGVAIASLTHMLNALS